MKHYLNVISLLISLNVSSQGFQTTVSTGLSKNRSDVIIKNGSLYLFGGRESLFSNQLFLSKIDSGGIVKWAKTINHGFGCVSGLGSSSFAVYGINDSMTGWGYVQMCQLTKFDSSGLPQSSITIPESLAVHHMHPTSDGGTIAIAKHLDGYYNSSIFKTDSTGQFEWKKSINDDSLTGIPLIDIAEVNSSGYAAIASYYYPYPTILSHYLMLIRLNNLGDTIWTRSYELNNSYEGQLVVTPNNEFLILWEDKIMLFDSLGYFKWGKAAPYLLRNAVIYTDRSFVIGAQINNGNGICPGLIRMDTLGNIDWVRKYYTMTDYSGSLLTFQDSGFILNTIETANNNECTLVKTDSLGISSCDSILNNPVMAPFTLQIASFQYGITVSVSPFIHYPTVYLYQFDTTCNIVNHCFQTDYPEINSGGSFTLSPNPATSQFVATRADRGENFTLEIFNLLGKKIYTDAAVSSGPWTVDCRPFPPGIYFVRLSNSDTQQTQKLVISGN